MIRGSVVFPLPRYPVDPFVRYLVLIKRNYEGRIKRPSEQRERSSLVLSSFQRITQSTGERANLNKL